jgi:predicted type IV restriction endonuclease
MQSGANEAFSHIIIDKALEFSGWNLLDSHQVRFELNTATGRADYLFCGQPSHKPHPLGCPFSVHVAPRL